MYKTTIILNEIFNINKIFFYGGFNGSMFKVYLQIYIYYMDS